MCDFIRNISSPNFAFAMMLKLMVEDLITETNLGIMIIWKHNNIKGKRRNQNYIISKNILFLKARFRYTEKPKWIKKSYNIGSYQKWYCCFNKDKYFP